MIKLVDKKLETLAYRLKDLSTLRNLFSELNFDFADKPVNKDNWNDEQKKIVQEAKIIASKDDYQIYYIQTNTDSLKEWKGISSKIIKDNNGLCMICSHNPSGFKWIFSSLSKDFSKSFSETRHVPIDINPDAGVPRTFVEFLEKIKVEKDSTSTSIVSQISEAFDSFAIKIHDELTVNVFEALKVLSEGIIADKNNNLSVSNETLEEIRESIFILLYRIIFILYAEDRGIFPIDNSIYRNEFSIKWMKEKWLLKSFNQNKINEYQVQERFKKLFRLIEVGSEELDFKKEEFFMRSYYGRIFDRNLNQKLENWKINNSIFLETLRFLTRTRDKNGNYFFLDYSALETRHLGSIYEHLLEFHLDVKNNKIEELPNANDRKKSGSYFTPKRVVDYIVKSSIEPLIEDIIKNNSDKQIQIEKILSLKILDPAMGSGHFLVGVIEYVAKRLCEIEFGEINESLYVERKRDVVRKCIYGVDINPLSVDLARLSLWLETLSSEKPLSFLSAHLKCGNSLVGKKLETLFEKQTTLFESEIGRSAFKKNLKKFLMFENLEDDTPTSVKMKLEEYDKMQSQGTVYYDLKFLLDSKLSEFFNISIPNLGDYRAKIGENSLDFYTNNSFQQVKEISCHERFFHWELEFPDIFYDENGKKKSNGGFDVVLGNPPYIQKNAFNETQKQIILNIFPENSANLNTAALFITQSKRLLKNNGYFSMIIPKSLTFSKSWLKDRQELSKNLLNVIDVSKAWKDVLLEQIIFVSQKSNTQNFYEISSLDLKYDSLRIEKNLVDMIGTLPTSINKIELEIFHKILKTSFQMGQITNTFCGLPYQSKLKQTGKHPMIGGKEIARYKIKGIKGFFTNEFYKSIKEKTALYEQPKIITQDIVAHVKNPEERVILMSTFDDSHMIPANTLNCTVLENSDYDLKALLAILNSELISWYSYNFIFNKAIRTMHFYEFFISKIPISKNLLKNMNGIKNISELLIFQNKQEENDQKLYQELTWILELMLFEIYFENTQIFNIKIQKFLSKLFNNTSTISSKHVSELLEFSTKNDIQEDMKKLFSHDWFNVVTNNMYKNQF